MSTPPTTPRLTWMMIVFAMATATMIYGFVIWSIHGGWESSAAQEPPRTLFFAGAAALAAASVIHTYLRLRRPVNDATTSVPPGPLMEPAEFMSRSVVSLALAESACVVGFVQAFLFHTPVREYVPFGLLGLAVMIVDAIPAGLSYWREWERRQQPASFRAPLE